MSIAVERCARVRASPRNCAHHRRHNSQKGWNRASARSASVGMPTVGAAIGALHEKGAAGPLWARMCVARDEAHRRAHVPSAALGTRESRLPHVTTRVGAG